MYSFDNVVLWYNIPNFGKEGNSINLQQARFIHVPLSLLYQYLYLSGASGLVRLVETTQSVCRGFLALLSR